MWSFHDVVHCHSYIVITLWKCHITQNFNFNIKCISVGIKIYGDTTGGDGAPKLPAVITHNTVTHVTIFFIHLSMFPKICTLNTSDFKSYLQQVCST